MKSTTQTREPTTVIFPSEPEWKLVYKKLITILDQYDPQRSFKLKGDIAKIFNTLETKLKDLFIDYALGQIKLEIAYKWIEEFNKAMNEIIKLLKIPGVLLSKELRSFIEDPRNHLRKKIFIYTHDLLRGRIDVDEYERRAGPAVRTSFRTNLRTLYQDWVLITVIKHLVKRGAFIAYPEHKYISLERLGKQKTGTIPPNLVLYLEGKGYLSFFIEAPRPIGWEDTSDLQKAWKLYTALRPDVLIYTGKVLNIVRIGQDPPIQRPNIILECKELEDWYIRVRDLKGSFTKPLTAEEWRSKWIQGLWTGLADVLGVSRTEVQETIETRKAIRLKEYQIITLYKSFYNPDTMILVSRSKIPKSIRKDIEYHGITIIDDVGFNEEKIRELADLLEQYAGGEESITIELSGETMKLLKQAYLKLKQQYKDITIHEVIRKALEKLVKEQ